jgi:hypothetical protein
MPIGFPLVKEQPVKWLIREIRRRFYKFSRERFPRYWSNQELRKIAPFFHGDIVNASAGEDIDKEGAYYESYFSKKNAYFLTNYSPGAFRGFQGRSNEYLLDLTDKLPNELIERFDVVFNHTTLEHIFDVRTAFKNLCLMSKDVVIVVVPFMQDQHEVKDAYQDYWRFTPTVLRTLYAENGLQTIYEAQTPFPDTTIYLFFVGAKYPERWQKQMPPYSSLEKVGQWIGRNHKLRYAPQILRWHLTRDRGMPVQNTHSK